MNDFEDRVRRALRSGVPAVEVEPLLAEVHRGATGRRRRRIAGAIAASALVVAGAAGVATTVRGDEGTLPEPPPATRTTSPSPSPTLPAGASRGVIDVSVVSADRWFRLTTNVGCVACSTVWQNEQSAEGGWERLHDFGPEAYVGMVNPNFGPIENFAMAEDGENGWAWGRRLYATHDGGRTWTAVTTGPGRANTEYGHQVGITEATGTAWSLLRTDQDTELWRTSLGSDEWVRADAPNMRGVGGMLTLGDTVMLETSDEGLSAPRLQFLGIYTGTWGKVANPCPGENRAYPSTSTAFMLCPAGRGAKVYRLIGFEHVDKYEWQPFGFTSGPVADVVPVGDRQVLLVGKAGRATLMDENSTRMVDLGTRAETFESSTDGRLVLLTTSDNTVLQSTDGGRTWGPAPE